MFRFSRILFPRFVQMLPKILQIKIKCRKKVQMQRKVVRTNQSLEKCLAELEQGKHHYILNGKHIIKPH